MKVICAAVINRHGTLLPGTCGFSKEEVEKSQVSPEWEQQKALGARVEQTVLISQREFTAIEGMATDALELLEHFADDAIFLDANGIYLVDQAKIGSILKRIQNLKERDAA